MASTSSVSFTEVKASCFCGQLKATAGVPTTSLPMKLLLCHCDICRHVTGLLCTTVVFLPEGSTPLQVQGKSQCYETSERLSRHFCGQCGTFVYDETSNPSGTALCSGALEKAQGFVELGSHLFVADTKDGGLREWLPHAPAWEGMFNGMSRELPIGLPFERTGMVPSPAPLDDILHARCHCGGVQLEISRPSAEEVKVSTMMRLCSRRPEHEDEDENKDFGKAWWWASADHTKYKAGLCVCNSCRLAAGFDLQTWVYVPKVNIKQRDGAPLDFNMGTLKMYSKNQGIYHDFCGVCGATVFWHSDKQRPEVIDISAGLLESPVGARAEDWLQWRTDRMSFQEDAQNKVLIEELAAGMKAWETDGR
ncbi:hypothetical protein MMC19_004052 [Ptychographa xylographoides]|nr:hypothetical protein [Ptychographa xylographoides]